MQKDKGKNCEKMYLDWVCNKSKLLKRKVGWGRLGRYEQAASTCILCVKIIGMNSLTSLIKGQRLYLGHHTI